LLLVTASCAVEAAVPPEAASGSEDIAVEKADPPAGSRAVGNVEATHGEGCGFAGTKGTYEGALVVLRNKAAELGGNYVRVMGVTAPHPTGGCYDDRFVIIGDVFRVAPGARESAPTVSADNCSPPCSPGYACGGGVCRAQCNPACGADQVCRQDRTCGPATP